MQEPPDEELVKRVLDGNVGAYGPLIDRHKDRCIRYVFRVLGDMDVAEDVVQEAFVRAYKSLPQCKDPHRFRVWLFQIVVNCSRSTHQLVAKREQRFVPLAGHESDIAGAAKIADPEHYQSERIDAALATLPEQMREAILLKYMEDMTYDEMSKVTGTGISALKMRVNRGTELLRKLLTNEPAGAHHGR